MTKTSDVVAIMAGGLSMTPAVVDAVRAAGVRSVVINNTWTLMPDADCLVACDAAWWHVRNPRVSPTADEFKGERVVMCQKFKVTDATFEKPHPILLGSNSALQAAWREARRGARRLLLFGVDLRDDELTHHYGPHKWAGPRTGPSRPRFARARKAWAQFAAGEDRPEVINCSERSALECFPKMAMEAAFGLSVP